MEVATVTPSGFGFYTHKSTSPPTASRAARRYSPPIFSSSTRKISLSTSFTSPVTGTGCGGVTVDLFGTKNRHDSVNPAIISSSRGKRSVVAMVIPFTTVRNQKRPPPNLASYLLNNRIVYCGMALSAEVTELLIAEFLYFHFRDDEKPIYFYLNTTGKSKVDKKLSYEREALAIYDMMNHVKAPIFTLCVGNAWGEAAFLLASGSKGNRAALSSSSIMIKQPIGRFHGPATDVNTVRNEMKHIKTTIIELLAKNIGKSTEEIEADISRPKYFTPSEAVEYGIIDKVLFNEKSTKDHGAVADLKKGPFT